MSGWGTSAERANMPSWLPDHLKDACVLTDRGWEIQALGNNNPDARELLVSGNFVGFSTGANEAPTVYMGYDNPTALEPLLGVSGAAIDPYFVYVFDLEQNVSAGLTWATYPTLPAGLALATAGEYAFTISGTPTETGTGTIGITFTDGASTAYITIGYNITL